jgi:hypothetical protein
MHCNKASCAIRYIPASNDWASVVAAELGTDIANVITNQSRKQPRFFLIDPSLNINGAGLPYTQTIAGSANLPISPRVMILSSVGRALPPISGVPSADFTNIWNAADGTVPSTPAFSSWAGSGDDLKVQRVNFLPLFVQLALSSLCFYNDERVFDRLDQLRSSSYVAPLSASTGTSFRIPFSLCIAV